MQQRRIDACKNLSADHLLQPPMIEPIQSVLADAEGVDDHTGQTLQTLMYHYLIPTHHLQPKQHKHMNHQSYRT